MPGRGQGQRLDSGLGVPPTRAVRATPQAGEALGRSHLLEAGVQLALTVKGQRWALWGRAAQFPAEDRAQSRGDQAGGGGGNPAKGAEPPDAVGAG